jgi:hypothetical protein
MSDDPNQIIESYLNLVKGNLPEAIAEDVISELRDYIHEAALEEGAGKLTARSAKKAVAQFGAPSEVAQEYTLSMMAAESDFDILETERSKASQQIIRPSIQPPPPEAQSPPETSPPPVAPQEVETPPAFDTVEQIEESEEEPAYVVPEEAAATQEPQPVPEVTGEVKPYSLIYLQALFWTGFVLLLTWGGLVIFRRPHFPYYIFQAAICMFLITLQLVSWRSKGINIHRHPEYHSEFSWFDNFTSSPYMIRLVTILTPDRKFTVPQFLKYLDVFGSILATGFLLLYPVNVAMIILLPVRALVVYMASDRNQEIELYFAEMFLTLGLLVISNAQFMYYLPFLYMSGPGIVVAVILSPYLLYRIVTRSQEFWDYVFPERSMITEHRVEEVAEEETQAQLQKAPSKESYPSVLGKYVGLTVIWLLAGAITASYFIYPLLRYDIIVIVAIQFVICSGLGVLLLLNSSRNEEQFWDVSYPEWSWLQRVATFPRNSPFTPSKSFYEIDIILDIIGIFVMLGTWMLNPGFAPAAALVLFLILKLYYSKKRLGYDDPISFVKQEFIVNLGALVLLNTIWLYSMSWRIVPWYSWVPAEAGIHALIATPFIILLLTISTQDLWWEHAESVERIAERRDGMEEVVPTELIKKSVKDAQTSTIARIFGWNVVVGAVLFFTLLINASSFGHIVLPDPTSIFAMYFIFLLGACLPILMYFKFREVLLLRKKARSVIGKGTRAGGILDALFSTGAFVVVLLVYLTPSGTRPAVDIFSGLLLMCGLIMRIEAGIQQFMKPGSAESLEAMVAASLLCLIGLGPLFVKVSSLYNIIPGGGFLGVVWFSWISYALFAIMLFQNLVAFQLATTVVKETGGLANLFKLEGKFPEVKADDRLTNIKKNGKDSNGTPEIVG